MTFFCTRFLFPRLWLNKSRLRTDSVVCQLRGEEPWSVVFADFCSVNTTSMANFKHHWNTTECRIGKTCTKSTLMHPCKLAPVHGWLNLRDKTVRDGESRKSVSLFYLTKFTGVTLANDDICEFQVYVFITWHLCSLLCTHHPKPGLLLYIWPPLPSSSSPRSPSPLVTPILLSVIYEFLGSFAAFYFIFHTVSEILWILSFLSHLFRLA